MPSDGDENLFVPSTLCSDGGIMGRQATMMPM